METTKPLLRGHFHQAMFFVLMGACVPLILKSTTATQILATVVYSMGVLTLFGVSAIYHRINWNTKKRALLKKLDHAAIYIMIAGTFTPIALLSLSETSRKTLLITIWSVTCVGIIQSIFFVNLPKIINAIIYIITGFLVIPYLPEIKNSVGNLNAILIVVGGIIYSLGALAYGLKRPILKPTIFGYHEVFHVLVSIAAIIHYFVIHSLVKNNEYLLSLLQ